MKKVNLIIAFLLSSFIIFAQDIIEQKSGEEIKAKVTEVTATEIKYHKFENLQGPVYSIGKKEVFKIRYENGQTEMFSSVSGKPAKKKLTVPQKYIRGGLTMLVFGAGHVIGAPFMIVDGMATNDIEKAYATPARPGDYTTGNALITSGIVMACVGVAMLGVGSYFVAHGAILKKKPVSVGFLPIKNIMLDKTSQTLNKNKIAAVTLTF